MDEVEFWEFMQVEDTGGKTCDQDVCLLMIGSSCQIVKIPLFVEVVSVEVN